MTDSTDLELGIENCRAKMRAHGLLEFVDREEGSFVGTFHFHVTDVDAFKARLVELGFTEPRGDVWDSRELIPVASLHFKHFEGWPATKVQAHIDPYGAGGPLRWLMHLIDYNGYRDVRRIRKLLNAQGRDPSAP